MVNDEFDFTAGCSDPRDCDYDILEYTLPAYDDFKAYYKNNEKPQVIGIAKDGHIITGPYNKNEEAFCEETDLCNGYTDGDNYYYASTTYHPYFVGCWGPSNDPGLLQECSTNLSTCSSEYIKIGFYAIVASVGLVFAF